MQEQRPRAKHLHLPLPPGRRLHPCMQGELEKPLTSGNQQSAQQLCLAPSPLKVQVIATRQNGPPDAPDVLLGSVDNKFVKSFQGQILFLRD